MKKNLFLSALLIVMLTFPFVSNAQYTPIICGPGLTPAVNFVFVGSISMDPTNGSNSQKLQVDVFGGTFLSNSKGVTTYYIANRGGLSVNQVTMGGSTGFGSLVAYQNGSATNFYLSLNSAADYYSFAVRGYLFGYTIAGSSVSITTQTATPAGTNITSSLNIKPVLITDDNGNIGLGTFAPDAAYKLSVNGKIRAKEIKVETGWADFVFDKDYKLMSLEEVENYIDKNHHLPDVPSQKYVAANGVDIGEMNKILTQKIEELTLYLIEANKQAKKQQNRIDKLEKASKLRNTVNR